MDSDQQGSPELLQERYAGEPWKLLTACVLLNITTRKQVDKVIDELFERWPSQYHMEAANRVELMDVIRPLGLCRRRTSTLIGLARAWVEWEFMTGIAGLTPSENEIQHWPGIGPYARDSYRWFVLEDFSRFDSADKELAAYLERRP